MQPRHFTFVILLGLASSSRLFAQAALPFGQDWSNTSLITTNDDWSGVPNIIGYRGDDLTTATGQAPDTILADGSLTPIDVNANQTNPNTFATGGVTEFEILNPVVALQGSGTADAPHLVISLNTTGQSNIYVQYDLRDIDGSTDNAVQSVALQYRVGSSGTYTNIPAGYVSDATTGPSLADLVTPVAVTLPAGAENQPLVQIRIMTTNAVGNDEWVGIDNISIQAGIVPVQLCAFTGRYSAASRCVDLNWQTASEVNNYGFYTQRSSHQPPVFVTLPSSFRPGYGTTSQPRDYAFTDCSVTAGIWYYRLEQVDLDGTLWHSEPIRIEVSSPTAVRETAPGIFALHQNYPNPFNPGTKIRFSVEHSGKTKLTVFNLLGQEVVTLFDDVADAGKQYGVEFNGANLTSGIYFSKLSSGANTAVRKLALVK